MKYYSTSHSCPEASLEEAVIRGLAPDKGLYMPRTIPTLPASFIEALPSMSLTEAATGVAKALFGEDIPGSDLESIVESTLSFDCPVVKVKEGIYSLELFHGPTLAFKDVGARFMARMLSYLLSHRKGGASQSVNVLVATSGDTGSAVANGFLGVEGVRVFVLYPKGRVSPVQESQIATLGQNITALQVEGNFDDCQALVKAAFMDGDLRSAMLLTSANSINLARFLPQSFYYFGAYAALRAMGHKEDIVACVPSGNFGNICSGLIGKRMGLPIKRFIASNNLNDVFFQYLRSGVYSPRESIATYANAMDVGAPSNFARILDLYGGSVNEIRKDIEGYVVDDDTILRTMKECLDENGYLLDPHGACAYRALSEGIKDGEVGFFCETAHPAKFPEVVMKATLTQAPQPERLTAFLGRKKESVTIGKDFPSFKEFLLSVG